MLAGRGGAGRRGAAWRRRGSAAGGARCSRPWTDVPSRSRRDTASSPAALGRYGLPRWRCCPPGGAHPPPKESSGHGGGCVKYHVYFRPAQASRARRRPGPEAPPPGTGQGGPGGTAITSRSLPSPQPPSLPSAPRLPCGISLSGGSQSRLKLGLHSSSRGQGGRWRWRGRVGRGLAGGARSARESGAGKTARVARTLGSPCRRLRRPGSSRVSLGPGWGSPQPGRVLCRFSGLRHASALAGGCLSRGCPLPVAQAVLPGHGPGIRVWCLADADPVSTRGCLCHRRASPFP